MTQFERPIAAAHDAWLAPDCRTRERVEFDWLYEDEDADTKIAFTIVAGVADNVEIVRADALWIIAVVGGVGMHKMLDGAESHRVAEWFARICDERPWVFDDVANAACEALAAQREGVR